MLNVVLKFGAPPPVFQIHVLDVTCQLLNFKNNSKAVDHCQSSYAYGYTPSGSSSAAISGTIAFALALLYIGLLL